MINFSYSSFAIKGLRRFNQILRCHHRLLSLIYVFLTIVDLVDPLVVALEGVQVGEDAYDLGHQEDQTRELNGKLSVDTRIQLPPYELVLVREQYAPQQVIATEIKNNCVDNQYKPQKNPVLIVERNEHH